MALGEIFLGDAIRQRTGVPNFKPPRENVDTHAAGCGTVIAMGQRIDEGLTNGFLGIEGRILPLGVAFDETRDAGRVADDEGVSLLEDAVKRSLEGLHIAELVPGLVRVVTHRADADLRQADGGIAGEEHIAAVGEAAVFGGGEILQHHKRLGRIPKVGAADLMSFLYRELDLTEINVGVQIGE